MNYMSKDKYLLQIKNEMIFRFSHKQIGVTLEDINSIFIDGEKDGKTDEEIITLLGCPKELVSSLLEHNSSHHRLYYLINFLSLTMLCVILIMIFLNPDVIIYCVFTPVVFFIVYYLFGGNSLYRINIKSEIKFKIHILFYSFTLFLILIEQAFVLKANTPLIFEKRNIMLTIGNYLYSISTAVIMLSIIILLIALIKLYKGCYLSLGVFLMSFGTILSLLLYKDFVSHFDAPGGSSFLCSLPYVVSVALLMVHNLLHFVRREER